MTVLKTPSAVIKVAEGEVGYLEKKSNANLYDKTANAGRANYTKYAQDFDTKYPTFYNFKKQSVAWCDIFVDWCFVTAFGEAAARAMLYQPTKSAGAGCSFSAGYYRSNKAFYSTPKVGDQIFFGTRGEEQHTGLVYKVDASRVYTIEGNTSNASGVVANGGGVAKKSYALTDKSIAGYGRPKYDAEAAPAAKPAEPAKPAAWTPKVGDIVKYTGSVHYATANTVVAKHCKGGKAKITKIYQLGKSRHPYHLVAVAGGGSTVYGWVNAGTFTKA